MAECVGDTVICHCICKERSLLYRDVRPRTVHEEVAVLAQIKSQERRFALYSETRGPRSYLKLLPKPLHQTEVLIHYQHNCPGYSDF